MQTILSFGTWKNFGLGKVSTKRCDQLHVFSLWRLTWVFDGTWKNFHKKVCPVTRFFRCGDYLKFWIGLRKISTKMCAQLHVFAVQTILSFWMGLRKLSTKRCGQLHLFRSADYLKFWIGLRKVSTKMCAQLHVFSLWRLTWVFGGTWKNFHKKVCPVICFFAMETNLSFWWDLWKIFTKKCTQSHVSSLWRLS